MMTKKILVTGADGFIGSHLVEMLVHAGYEVRAGVQYNSFNSHGWLDNIPCDIFKSLDITPMDIRDPFATENAVRGCEYIMHLAALIAIPYSYIAPESYVQTNILGSLNLLQAAKKANIQHFIHTSTSEIYGTAQFVPIDEGHPFQPQSPYSASKIGADSMVMSYYHSFDLPVTILRPFNTYGPRQSARAVIPAIITQILKGASNIQLGTTHPTRDLNFVTDTAASYIATLKCDASVGKSINIGNNFDISIGDLAHLIAEIMGADIHIICDERRLRPPKSEVDILRANNELALNLLKWRPHYGGGKDGLKKGLTETINWFANPDNLKFYKAGGYII